MRSNKRTNTTCDYEIIHGKPHLGLWFGTYVIVNIDQFKKLPLDENHVFVSAMAKLRHATYEAETKDPTLKTRYAEFIVKPAIVQGPLCINASLAAKYMVWGRAFKVMRLIKKGIKRYAKKWRSGKRKYVRIDK